ncbi:MAG: multiheme c-type cytochrome [Gemmatimonadota bacterium]
MSSRSGNGGLNRRSLDESWRSRLLLCVGGLLLFETLTGLSMWLLPFSLPNQVMVLLHTGAGLAFLTPFAWYQAKHWLHYRRMRLSHVVLTGYVAMAATLVALVTGVVLTGQALLGTRIGYAWDLVHIIATFGVIGSVLPHVVVLMVRALRARAVPAVRPVLAAQRRFGLGALALAGLLIGVAVLLARAYRPVELRHEFPDDYSYLYGPDRPFAPSLATTATGGALDPRALGGSDTCGSGGCHEQVKHEWEVSAHRYSAMDPAFQAVQTVMAKQNGAESTRYCGGCHDPISLFSGTKNVFAEDLTNQTGYQEGVSCVVCHAIKKTDIKGNANYVMTEPDRYMFELKEGAAARRVSDFLIRAYPRHHVETLQHKLFKSPEFCAACHKQFIDQEVNQVGWVQLQNQYDNWRKSRWNHPGDPSKTIECRECHMPLLDTPDPGNGDDLDYNRTPDDGKHRSHRFLAANQFVPVALKLPGAEEHVELIRKWLRGEIEVPEIADKWKSGPALPVELVVPQRVAPGQKVKIQAVITNNKVGHEFPTGPLDIIQAWLEVKVTDQDGQLVFESGGRDERHFIHKGSFIFKAEPVDQYGNLIDRHNLWEMVGVRYKRAVFPGFSDRAEFTFQCPALLFSDSTLTVARSDSDPGDTVPLDGEFAFRAPHRVTALHVSVKLLYRKFDQFLLNFLFGEDAGMTAPVTVLSEDEKTITVAPRTAD